MEETSIQLVSINIEGKKHHTRVLPFLHEQDPDVICLQEVFEPDFELFKKEFGMDGLHVPITRKELTDASGTKTHVPWGIGIISRLPIKEKSSIPYYTCAETLQIFDKKNINDTADRVLASMRVEKENTFFTVATTHFTWTPDGNPSEIQWRDMSKLFDILDNFPDIILCGDFNAPRGGEIFDMLAKRYTDNIPPHYITSLDHTLHRVAHLDRMVDGLFTTNHYQIRDVRLVCGVSDHCAVVAVIHHRPQKA